MQGLEEAKKLYENFGAVKIHADFPEYEGRIAFGLAGHGSECFGFDDELSRDHDFEPGFCMWLTDEDDIKAGPRLARIYREIIAEAFPGGTEKVEHSLMAEKKLGVMRTCDFFRRYTGADGAPESLEHWLAIPSWALAEATNGQIWRDDLGEYSAIREILLYGMPEDVRKKKIAAKAILMAQSGQYNYSRCLKHGETGAAQLALSEFVKECAEMIYLLNRAHAPYYKWLLRGIGRLEILSGLKDALEFLLVSENTDEGTALKAEVIEDICQNIILELVNQNLTDSSSTYLEKHAYEVQERIEDRRLRAMHIMEEQ